MKVTIDASGYLTVTPETGCEAYALGHWAEENLAPLYKQVIAPQVRILIDCSNFPESLQPVFAAGAMKP
ncbi:hypothetical protein [Paraburkholderia sp.]|uniref:hypothetical protein n=1 Tax=Paraburkholderia sp. TaxID=1926495 RepID=UPI00286EE598|nr:hypothetical protein [Paraburkholderia sp.]